MNESVVSNESTVSQQIPSSSAKSIPPSPKPFWWVLFFLAFAWIVAGIILFVGRFVLEM